MLFIRQRKCIRKAIISTMSLVCTLHFFALVPFFLSANDSLLYPQHVGSENLHADYEYRIKPDLKSKLNEKLQLDRYRSRRQQELSRILLRNENVYKRLQKQFDVHQKQERIDRLRLLKKDQEARNFSLLNFLLSLIIVLTILFLFLLFFHLNRKKKEKAISSAAINRAKYDAIEKEKFRFSREIHDGLQGTLSIIHLMSNRELVYDPKNENLQEVSKLSKKAMYSSMGTSKELYPSEIVVDGLSYSVNALIERTNLQQNKMCFIGKIAPIEFPPEIGITLYRIIEEFIDETLRYSNASQAIIELKQVEQDIEFNFFENGIHRNRNVKEEGMANIANRVAAIGGKLSITQKKNHGLKLKIRLKKAELNS
jgi:two-component system NarL family sensor kinase